MDLKVFTDTTVRSLGMLTVAARIDTLGYFDRLTSAGVPEAQARIQAELFREQADFQTREFQELIEKYDAARRKDLATRGDVQDVRLEIERVRAELKTDIEKIRAELKTDIEKAKYNLLKWQIGLAVGLVMIMAKGFNWIGF